MLKEEKLKGFTTLLTLFLISINCYSQKEAANWYFGNRAGLDFNSGSPVSLVDGEMSSKEGCSTISDSHGNLLFYTNGVKVWDRNHIVMPNGTGLHGGNSSAQCIVVPLPGSLTIYYIFTTSEFETNNSFGLQYSILDITLNGGLGDITTKNKPLQNDMCEMQTVVRHANGKDLWVISHKSRDNKFIAYLLTQSGLNNIPVRSSSGLDVEVISYIKASTDGAFLALTSYFTGGLELFQFNNATGILNNPIDLSSAISIPARADAVLPYGIEFSLDSNKLYVSSHILLPGFDENTPLGGGSNLFQLDVSTYNAIDIISSAILIADEEDIAFGGIQLAIDKKIYVAQESNPVKSNYLGVINKPNATGHASTFQINAVYLDSRESRLGLPFFIASSFTINIFAENFCLGHATDFSFNTDEYIISILWDFGDAQTSTLENPSHTFTQPGDYNVSVTIRTGSGFKTETRCITIYDIPVANSVSSSNLCVEGNIYEFDLSTKNNEILGTQPEANYKVEYYSSFSNAENGVGSLPILYRTNTNTPETIYVKISNAHNPACFDITSFDLTINSLPEPNIEEIYYICPDNPQLAINGGDFESWLWKDSAGNIIGFSQSINLNELGNYSLTVTLTSNGITCEKTVPFTVLSIASPVSFEVDISGISNQITLTVNVSNIGEFEYSIDGENYQPDNVFIVLPGEYTIYVRDKIECKTLSNTIFALGYRHFFTPNGDGINERWHIIGIEKYPNSVVYIYNRYGKLLKQLLKGSEGWDGNYNGNQLPSSDYWFSFEYDSGKVFKGHFSLKR